MTKIRRKILVRSLLIFLLLFGFTATFSAAWYKIVYGNTGFDSILFTLFGNNAGVEPGLVYNYLLKGLLPAVLCTIATSLLLFYHGKPFIIKSKRNKKSIKLLPIKNRISVIISLVLSIVLFLQGAFAVELPQWLFSKTESSSLIEEEYVFPEKTLITFPEKKRNLIYIFMESMETTFMARAMGGAMEKNLVPELYRLAGENINFSQNMGVGGWPTTTGTSWTIASLVAQTSGLIITTDGNEKNPRYGYLPGAVTINDVLHDNGYYQTFMIGSDAAFGNRGLYYTQHKVDRIYDLNTAREDNIVPNDYYVWWGMEDKYLYKYAKEELTEIAKKDRPFAFSMLTVDTHHVDGYLCSECKNTHNEQYSNVISCASKQVSEFIAWVKQQDFYENTTIVIVGDHLSMDNEYIKRNISPDYTRRVYNCIINSAIKTDNTKNRDFSPLDMFPTTLAAMGCKITGERLGLGVNLFSTVPTIMESRGRSYVMAELQKNSPFYKSTFLTPQKGGN